MPSYPVADECPRCRCREYTSVGGDRFFTFAPYDRICKECQTRYTPRLSEGVKIAVRIVGGLSGGLVGLIIPAIIDSQFLHQPGGQQGNLETFPIVLAMCCTFPVIGAVTGWLIGWGLTWQPRRSRRFEDRDYEPRHEDERDP
jgi:hypothetical protein